MGLFDGGLATYATWAIILALVGVLIWFFVIRKSKKTKKSVESTKDGYEDEAYEDEAYEDESYEDETYDEETYDEETYDEETYDEEA